MKKKKLFECKTPCGNCPYRKDSEIGYWSILEFQNVLEAETKLIPPVFLCHKNNGSICIGYLMNQKNRDFPSNGLRLSMRKHGVDRNYLDSLFCKSEMYETVEEMCEVNFEAIRKDLKAYEK